MRPCPAGRIFLSITMALCTGLEATAARPALVASLSASELTSLFSFIERVESDSEKISNRSVAHTWVERGALFFEFEDGSYGMVLSAAIPPRIELWTPPPNLPAIDTRRVFEAESVPEGGLRGSADFFFNHDADVWSGTPDFNSGDLSPIYAGLDAESFLPGVGYILFRASTFFVNGTITNATLSYHVEQSVGSWTVGAWAVADGAANFWSEGTVTWNNQPALGDLQDFETVGTASDYYKFMDITSIAQQWNAGSHNNNGLFVAPSGNPPSGAKLQVTASEFGTDAPYIFVEYSPPASAPTVTTNAATSISQTSATLNASVDPNGSSTTVFFDYGTTPGLGSTVTHGGIGSGTSPVSTPQSLTGLSCGTQYYFRARASNSGGTSNGNTLNFNTTACPQPPPTVTTNAATSIGQTSATLNASVDPNGSSTTVFFDYGTTPGLGSTVTHGGIGSGTSPVSTPQSLTGLSCGTQYYFRARASSAGGSTNGATLSFSTASCGGGAALSNGVTQAGSINGSVQQGSWNYYYADLAAGASNLVVELFDLGGDLDLYVRFGAQPTDSLWDCRPFFGSTNSEACTFPTPSAGRWWVGVNNWDTGPIGYSVRATWSTSSGGIVVNEIHTGPVDYVELYNSGSSSQNLSGWTLVSTGGATDTHTLPSYNLSPGAFVRVFENTGSPATATVYTGQNFNWVSADSGSVALSNGSGTGVDFVRWGISSTPPPSGTTWSAPNAPSVPSDADVIGRSPDGSDSNSGSDWCPQTPSAPGPNSGCGGVIFSDGFESGNTSSWSSTSG
ncbi:MAG: hypothetical protein DWQ36_14715 [Acidobacteria bacterium]|nr:MAG: hypothetical protein DWQ30_03450 [Acidobacteriota bacterium]REK06144.1 MAG: hypothetical protein DWQ36_14715 [Acidobacteriota bacterium]